MDQFGIMVGNNSYYTDKANGYIEKNWGKSIPTRYVWAQVNDSMKNSFVFSNATVPMLGKSAEGFFAVFYYKGKEYRFSTVEFSKMLNFTADGDSFKTAF